MARKPRSSTDLPYPGCPEVTWQRPLLTTASTVKPGGAWFDPDAADRAVGFFPLLPLIDGERAGAPMELLPWMEHEVVRPLFGWMRADGTRLYRECYLRVARKNGKSTLCAGIGGKLTFADGEAGARVYAAAVDTDQAREVFDTVKDSVEASRALSPGRNKRVKVLRRSVTYKPKGLGGAPARFHILSGETKNKDGLNLHGGIIDELHAHPSRDMYDLLNQGTASRRQPLIFSITTAGVVAEDSVCLERDDYTRRVTTGQVDDPAFLGVIYALADGDDWRDEANWPKANPSIGVTISREFLRREAAKAQASPAAQNAFRMKHMNEWMQQHTRWIDLLTWDESAGSVVEPNLRGRVAYAGLDLASVSDLTAWVLVVPGPHECHEDCVKLIPRFFLPEAALEKGQYVPLYQQWHRAGLLTVTPGNATDYAFVRQQVIEDGSRFDIEGLAIDYLFQGGQLAGELLEEGLPVEAFRQGFLSYAMPMKAFEHLLLEGKLHHGGNPVLRWMADSVVVKQDPAGNLKPDRDKSQGKIDGIAATVMGLDFIVRAVGGPGGIDIVDLTPECSCGHEYAEHETGLADEPCAHEGCECPAYVPADEAEASNA